MRGGAIVIAMLGSVLLGAAPDLSDIDPGIRAFVQHWETESRAIKSIRKNEENVAARCRMLTDGAFDFDVMAHDAFADIWETLGPVQRQSLAAALDKRTVSNCVDRIGDYGGGPFTLLGVRTAEDGTKLATANVRAGGGDLHVTWSLRRTGDAGWKAVDLSVNGRSLSGDFRGEFDRLLMTKKGSIAATVDVIARR